MRLHLFCTSCSLNCIYTDSLVLYHRVTLAHTGAMGPRRPKISTTSSLPEYEPLLVRQASAHSALD
ncbi:hypothetical protein ACSBR1_011086 [Camellia fascicularis]